MSTQQLIDTLGKFFSEVSEGQEIKFCWERCFNKKIPAEWLSLLEEIKANPEKFEQAWQSFVSKSKKDEEYYRWLNRFDIIEYSKRGFPSAVLYFPFLIGGPLTVASLIIGALMLFFALMGIGAYPVLMVTIFVVAAIVSGVATGVSIAATILFLSLLSCLSNYVTSNIEVCETTKNLNDLALKNDLYPNYRHEKLDTKRGVLTNFFAFFQSAKNENPVKKEILTNRDESNVLNESIWDHNVPGYGTL